MHNAADDPTIIDPRLAARIGRQQPFEPRELILGQPEMIAIHLWSRFEDRGITKPPPTEPLCLMALLLQTD
jgi:hypothetical protein